jgi:hypothetical protein
MALFKIGMMKMNKKVTDKMLNDWRKSQTK